ncbi:MAG: hypothetical protein ACRDRX_27970, partial [Pseudonocardiaceae bacterium]
MTPLRQPPPAHRVLHVIVPQREGAIGGADLHVLDLAVAAGSPSGVELTAGQLRSDGVRRERDTTDLPGAKNVADVSFT